MYENEATFSTVATPKRNSSKQDNYQTVVPWKNPEEFIEVFKKIYSEDATNKQWAIDQISVWETKCHPALPTAVEATVGLVEASIHDILYDDRKSLYMDRDIRAIYSMAIIRFVNLVLTSDHRDTLSNLAKKSGIPQFIVDLRHDASHAHTPSVSLLRLGARIALRHLRKNYWKREVKNLRQIIKAQPSIGEHIAEVISRFKEVQFSITEACDGGSDDQHKDLAELIKKLKKLLQNQNKIFVDILVEPGVFLSSNDIERTLKQVTDFLSSTNDFKLPSDLLKFWIPVIRMMHTANILSYFMESLLLSLEYNTSKICQKTAIAWVICLLRSADPMGTDSLISARFRQQGVHLEHARLLFASVKALNPYSIEAFTEIGKYHEDFSITQTLAPIIGAQHRFDQDTKDTAKSDSQKPTELLFTDKDLQCDVEKGIQEKCGKRFKFSYTRENIECDGLPLGCVINPIIPIKTEEDNEDMDTSVVEKYIIEEDDKEPAIKVERTTENVFPDPDIGDMISW